MTRLFPVLLFLTLLISACGSATPAAEEVATAEPSPGSAPSATPEATTPPTATVTLEPTVEPSPTLSPTPEATPTPEGLTDEQLLELTPNEIGWVMVLEYHLIEPGEDTEYSRTPDSFRADLEWLYEMGYYPVTFRDLGSANMDHVPAGRAPVVLAFDDSSIGQFRMLEDGSVDPESAMGILLDFSEQHPDFPPVATFFPLLEVDVDTRILWGQPEYIDEKLQMILDLGGEIGSHTVTHERLDQIDDERVQWQLGTSQQELEARIGNGYEVVSLALPLGMYPLNEEFLKSGMANGEPYGYLYAAEVAGGLSYSPYDVNFDPYHIARTQAAVGYVDNVYRNIEARPMLRYISDGDPTTLTVPSEESLEPEQQGSLDPAQWPDLTIRRYDLASSDE